MELRSNPAGNEEHEIRFDSYLRPDDDRVLGFERTREPDSAQGGGMRSGADGGNLHDGRSGLVRKA